MYFWQRPFVSAGETRYISALFYNCLYNCYQLFLQFVPSEVSDNHSHGQDHVVNEDGRFVRQVVNEFDLAQVRQGGGGGREPHNEDHLGCNGDDHRDQVSCFFPWAKVLGSCLGR